MEYLDSSRSARKLDPSRTIRYRRADPKSSSIVLGYDKNQWETTNKQIQKQVLNGIDQQGNFVHKDRRMTSTRKRGMLESTLSLGNAQNEWRTESKQHYHQHDLRSWGPRTSVQRDSYSWTENDRRKLAALRDASNAEVMHDISHYMKLPPIYAKPGSHSNEWNGYQSDFSNSNGNFEKKRINKSRGRQRGGSKAENDI